MSPFVLLGLKGDSGLNKKAGDWKAPAWVFFDPHMRKLYFFNCV
jgi:hypothetical protein